MVSMVADLARIYHYSIDHVLAMPMRRAAFLWSRGRIAERMQAFRIAGAMNGVDIDKEKSHESEEREVFRTGKPSAAGQAIIDGMMGGEDD